MRITLREWLLLVTIFACVCWCINLQGRLARSWEIKQVFPHNGDSRVEIQVLFISGGSMYFHRGLLRQANPDLMKAIELVEADQRK